MWKARPDPERRHQPMHARVATFNLGEGLDETINQVRSDVESGNRPPGLEDAKGVMMLVDRSSGKSIGITFFDDEDALKRGDEALNAMSPSGGGSRMGVEFYEVAVQRME
jgi:exopolysaccharide biosynthesis protein